MAYALSLVVQLATLTLMGWFGSKLLFFFTVHRFKREDVFRCLSFTEWKNFEEIKEELHKSQPLRLHEIKYDDLGIFFLLVALQIEEKVVESKNIEIEVKSDGRVQVNTTRGMGTDPEWRKTNYRKGKGERKKKQIKKKSIVFVPSPVSVN